MFVNVKNTGICAQPIELLHFGFYDDIIGTEQKYTKQFPRFTKHIVKQNNGDLS